VSLSSRLFFYCPRRESDSRIGPIDTFTMPSRGVSISRISKIAPDVDTEHGRYATKTSPEMRNARA
jgi:hypothetical protein